MIIHEVRSKLETNYFEWGMDYAMENQAELLRDLIQRMQIDLTAMNTKQLQNVADRLSLIEKKEPKWTWRYLRNVLNGKMKASRRLVMAIVRLWALINQTPNHKVSEKVQVITTGKVSEGALVLMDSRGNPGCGIEFIPRSPNQRYCCADCRKIMKKGMI